MSTIDILPPTAPDAHELEGRESFPVHKMPVAGYGLYKFRDDNFPPQTFSTHEDLIASKGENSYDSIAIRPNVPEARQQLLAEGFADGASDYGVPYTGARQSERDSEDFKKIQMQMTYNLAAIEAGLQEIDWGGLSPVEQEEIRKIGYQGTGPYEGALLVNGQWPGSCLTLSHGWDAWDDKSLLEQRAKDVGTYARVQLGFGREGKAFDCVAYTDQCGNQALAPASPTLDKIMSSVGYKELPEPTFATDFWDDYMSRKSKLNPQDIQNFAHNVITSAHRR